MGWRYWQFSPRGLLRSVSQRRIEWPVGQPLRATCVGGGHPPPADRCDCGVYGAPDLDTLREHGLCLSPEPLVVGQVALWGRVLSDERGIRGQYAYPATLSIVLETAVDDAGGLLNLTQQLEQYGVPVDHVGLDHAVAGVSAATLSFQAMAARASRTHLS